MRISKMIEIAEKLSQNKAWTDELRYVHYTRLIYGIVLGFCLGSIL